MSSCPYLTFSSTQLSPATNTSLTRPTPPPVPVSIPSLHSTSVAATTPTHTFPPPLFAAPLPPPAVTTTAAAPHPFSAESLFQSSKGNVINFPPQLFHFFFPSFSYVPLPPHPAHLPPRKTTLSDDKLCLKNSSQLHIWPYREILYNKLLRLDNIPIFSHFQTIEFPSVTNWYRIPRIRLSKDIILPFSWQSGVDSPFFRFSKVNQEFQRASKYQMFNSIKEKLPKTTLKLLETFYLSIFFNFWFRWSL